jgi:hypothetical protein
VNYPLDFSKPILKAEDSTNFIYELKPEIQFLNVESECFELNLIMLESRLPTLLAFMLHHQYQTGVSKISELLQVVKQVNPIGFDMEAGVAFYESRILRLLTALLSGMSPDVVWNGDDYMAFYLNGSPGFLLSSTQLDPTPAKEIGGFLKLSLQISFAPNAQHQI